MALALLTLPIPTPLPALTFSLRSVAALSTELTVDVVVSRTVVMEDLPARDAASLLVAMDSALRVDAVDVVDVAALLPVEVLRRPPPVTRGS